MRFLRMLTNAIAGGVLVALYLAVLVLQLNPQVPIVSLAAVRWFGALLAFYGPYLAAALYVMLLGLEAVAGRALRPGWFSVRLLAWLGAAGAAAAAAITWANLEAYRPVLSPLDADRMRQGAIATTVFAVVLVTIAVLRYSFGRKGSRATAGLLMISMVLSVAVPLWFRGAGETFVKPPRRWTAPMPIAAAPRVVVIALDGASLGLIRQRVAAGRLPNFGRMLDRGALIDLSTLQPTQAGPVWMAAATGKTPQNNGVRSESVYRVDPSDTDVVDILPDYCFASALVTQGFVTATPREPLRLRPMWDILADYGLASGIVGWPLTYPAHAERGYIVSDRFDEAASSPLRLADARSGDPTTAVDVAREHFDAWQGKPWRDVLPALSTSEPEPIDLAYARWDRAYSATAAELERQFAPRLSAVRYEGLAAFGHAYLREAEPELFGDVRRPDPQRSVLDRDYIQLDNEIGEALRNLAPGDLLLVVSGFGMERVPVAKRLFGGLLGFRNYSGTHEYAPDGFLLAYGSNVASGQFPRGAITDLAPTVLYYMGVPVGRDMDGFARTDLFGAAFTLEHPVKYVASHDK